MFMTPPGSSGSRAGRLAGPFESRAPRRARSLNYTPHGQFGLSARAALAEAGGVHAVMFLEGLRKVAAA